MKKAYLVYDENDWLMRCFSRIEDGLIRIVEKEIHGIHPLEKKKICPSCFCLKLRIVTTDGCDHCDFEGK